jgi:hypothetical protein
VGTLRGVIFLDVDGRLRDAMNEPFRCFPLLADTGAMRLLDEAHAAQIRPAETRA